MESSLPSSYDIQTSLQNILVFLSVQMLNPERGGKCLQNAGIKVMCYHVQLVFLIKTKMILCVASLKFTEAI